MSKKFFDIVNLVLCGAKSRLGDFAEFVNKGTEKEVDITVRYTKCWCCTFWRGIMIGLLIGLIPFAPLIIIILLSLIIGSYFLYDIYKG